MNSFLFWQRWLYYSSLLFALTGLLYAFTGNNEVFESYHRALAEIFWGTERLPTDVEKFRAFVAGPMGGTIACIYLLLAFMAKHPFKTKQTWAWIAIAVSFTVWFLVDSIVCVANKVFFQAYFINTFSFAIKILPLLFTKKYFFPKLPDRK